MFFFKPFPEHAGRGGSNQPSTALSSDQRAKLLSLPFKLIAARHRLDILDERLQQRILEARHAFHRDLPEEAKDQIEFFDPGRYNAAATVQDNVLFGKIAYGEAGAQTRVPAAITASHMCSAYSPG